MWQRLCNGFYTSQKPLLVAYGHHEAYGLIVQKAAMVGGVFALVHAQASNLRIMEGIASDQMKMMVFVTLKVVQDSYY